VFGSLRQGVVGAKIAPVGLVELPGISCLAYEENGANFGKLLSGAIFGCLASPLLWTEGGFAWADLVLGCPAEELGLNGQSGIARESGQGIGNFPLKLARLADKVGNGKGTLGEAAAVGQFPAEIQESFSQLQELWSAWAESALTSDRLPGGHRDFFEQLAAVWQGSLRLCFEDGFQGVLFLGNERKALGVEVLEKALVELDYLRCKDQMPESGGNPAIDWSSSKAWVEAPGRIYLNVIGRESQGCVRPNEFEKTRSALSHDLELWGRESSEKIPPGGGLRCLRPETVFGSISGRVPDLWVTSASPQPEADQSKLAACRTLSVRARESRFELGFSPNSGWYVDIPDANSGEIPAKSAFSAAVRAKSDRLLGPFPELGGSFLWVPNPREVEANSALLARISTDGSSAQMFEQAGVRFLPKPLAAHQVTHLLSGTSKEKAQNLRPSSPAIHPTEPQGEPADEEGSGEKLVRERLRALGYL
jgi:hypothetical protein